MSMEPEVLTEWTVPMRLCRGRYRITNRLDEYGQDVYALERFCIEDCDEWQVVNPSNPHHAAALIRRVLELSPR